MSVVQIIYDDGKTQAWTVNDETAAMVRAIIVLMRTSEERKKSS
jgi:hypothetical protein